MMRGTESHHCIVSRWGIILLLLLPLFSTAFVGHHSSGFFQHKLRLSSFQKSETVAILTALSIYSPSKNNHDDDEKLLSNTILNVNHQNVQPSTISLATTNEASSSSPSPSSSLLMVSALTMAPIVIMSLVAMMPLPAMAANGGSAIPSALWSYGHLLALLCMMGTVVAQKLLVQPSITKDDEGVVGMLNIAYSLALALLLASGYIRVAEFGKGASFYSHEITFWIKMAFTGVQGGLALFKTITLVKRGMDMSSFEPMSDKLVARMQQILNAELTGLVSIPLVAAFMARGVLYWEDFPWQAGAAFTVLATGGASFFYAKQALMWKDN